MSGIGRWSRVRRRGAPAAFALLVVAGTWSLPARAQDAPVQTLASPAAAAPAPSSRGPRFALGLSFGFLRQADLGGEIGTRVIPSLVGLAYVKLTPRLYLRPGARLGLAGIDRPPAATDARLEEHGLQARAELGLLYDSWLIPAVSVGSGVEIRTLSFAAQGNVQSSSELDRTETLGSVYLQAAVGLPLFRGVMVVEPFYRLLRTFSDDRSSSELGFDITFAL